MLSSVLKYSSSIQCHWASSRVVKHPKHCFVAILTKTFWHPLPPKCIKFHEYYCEAILNKAFWPPSPTHPQVLSSVLNIQASSSVIEHHQASKTFAAILNKARVMKEAFFKCFCFVKRLFHIWNLDIYLCIYLYLFDKKRYTNDPSLLTLFKKFCGLTQTF